MRSLITDSKLNQNNNMKINKKSNMKTADENSKLTIITEKNEKKKEFLFTVIIIKQ